MRPARATRPVPRRDPAIEVGDRCPRDAGFRDRASVPSIRAVSELVRLHRPGVSLVLDARHFPVVIGTWSGVHDPELLGDLDRWVSEIAERTHRDRGAFIIVSDVSGLSKPPSIRGRRRTAAMIDGIDERFPGTLLGVVLVMPGALMRAVAAMVVTVMRKPVMQVTARTVELAIVRALAILGSKGIAAPPTLDPRTYEPPSPP